MIQIEESNPSFESCNKCIYSDDSEETCILRRCIHAVAQLQECYVPKQPTIEPERKKGRWIYGEHDVAMCDGYWCDKCGFFVPWDYQHKFIDFIKDYHFCPNCGADMREPEDIPMEYFESGGR